MRGARELSAIAVVTVAACKLATSGDGSPVQPDAFDGPLVVDSGAKEGALDATDEVDGAGDAGDARGENDASACNAENCGGACCGDTCVPRECAACSSGHVFCPFAPAPLPNGYCVADCASCDAGGTAAPTECVSCATGTPVGQCTFDPVSCPESLDAGACGCDGSSDCAGQMQVCGGGACLSCGQGSTGGAPCSGGGACDETTGACK
jgi:hypothetical protein